MSDASSDPRCGYPKKDGSPCRNRVAADGKVCRIHQKAALLDRILKRDVLPASGAPATPIRSPDDRRTHLT
jgi:hypothetical protein